MAEQSLMVDSSILIDYFRKADKSKSRLVAHFREYERLYISSVTEFEVVNGATEAHMLFWDGMLSRFIVLGFDSEAARKAAVVVGQLKRKRKSMDKPDLFIAATALVHGLTLDTLNKRHFEHVEGLMLAE
ncbi:MAG: type II toxin-antitoxin system VapC family toxin [Bacteroidetes bacterium]|nr:type II toxin-antitoxin system VapC family toxin [Bacteroidota bacterium]MBS1945751.1 type II toxin-antitoxin system VapC family toxin [Bacteroidota bacterium]